MSTQHTPETLKQARTRTYGIQGKYREGFCCEYVPNGGRSVSFHQCCRKNGFGPAGLYCKQHDPAEVQHKQEAAQAKYDAKWNAVASRANREQECVNALAGVSDPAQAIAKAREALKAAQETVRLANEFLTDLQKSNPGWLGKLVLQRYDTMNEAYMALESMPAIAREALALLGEPEEQK